MYPILISAATTIASNVIDNWINSRVNKPAAPTENFAALLERNSSPQPGAASARESRIATLRQALLGSPEVHTLLATADPSKQPTLTLSVDGKLAAHAADGRTTPVLLSPEIAAAARELASLSRNPGSRPDTASTLLAPSSRATSL